MHESEHPKPGQKWKRVKDSMVVDVKSISACGSDHLGKKVNLAGVGRGHRASVGLCDFLNSHVKAL